MSNAIQDYTYAPNPTLPQGTWEDNYPPIVSTSLWLINKYTGEIVPNTEAFARRSDILQPYLGELPKDEQGEIVAKVNKVINDDVTEQDTQTVATGDEEMATL